MGYKPRSKKRGFCTIHTISGSLFLIATTATAPLACATGHQANPAQTNQSSSVDLNRLSLEQLASVRVTTVSKEPEALWNTAAAIYVITQDDIRRSGATTIPELLRLAPGVEVSRMDSDHWAVGIRGFGGQFSKSLLVLIDGRSVYSPLFSGVYWQVQDTLLQDIDRIEVIRGPGGTIWGANAVNGVINIITKKAANTHGFLSTVSGGNVDQAIAGARFGSGNNKGLDYRFYGKGFVRGAEYHRDGSNFDEWKMGQLGFRADWGINTRDSLRVQGDLYKGRDGERVARSTYSPPAITVVDAPHHTSGGNVVARWNRQFNTASNIEVRGYYDRTTRLSPQLDEMRNTFDIDLLYRFPAKGRQDILLGLGGRWSPDHIRQKFETLNFTPHDQTDSIYSWFAQDHINLVPNKVALTLGSKFEHNNRSGFEIQPSGRVLWTPSAHQSLWAAVTRAVRTPSRLDQDFQLDAFVQPNPLAYLRVVGDKHFKSEKLLGTEIGYRTLLGSKLYTDISIFRNSYNDLFGYGPGSIFIELAPAPPHVILQVPLANALKGKTSGGEISPDWKPVHWWELKGSYSYLHLYVYNKPGFSDTTNPPIVNGSSPHHRVILQSRLNLPKRFEFDSTYRFVSALPGQGVKSYHTLDSRFGWRASHGWDLAVVGQNLLQPHHDEFANVRTTVGVKRAVILKATWTR